MSISLQKGQKVDLTKTNEGLTKIQVGLGWDTNKFGDGKFDLDSSVFLLGAGDKVTSDKDLVFFGNLKSCSGAVTHQGDNLTGEGDGDDEKINVDLSLVPTDIQKIAFVVNIYDAVKRKQNFGMVSNAFIRLVDEATGTEIMKYDLGEDFSTETVVIIGELYKKDGEWKFTATGTGLAGGFTALCEAYGVSAN